MNKLTRALYLYCLYDGMNYINNENNIRRRKNKIKDLLKFSEEKAARNGLVGIGDLVFKSGEIMYFLKRYLI